MTKSYSDILRDARAQVREVSAAEVDAQREAKSPPLLLDVRETHEWEAGHLPGAVHVPRGHLESRIEGEAPDRSRPIVIYCASGVRSVFAAQTLAEMGYADVVSMAGGFQGWKSQGLPWNSPTVLTPEQKLRYSRHLLIPEVGAEGQARLLESTGPAGRGRRAGLTRLALPRRGGRRHDRGDRLRRRRPVEPPAPGRPHDRPGRPEEGRLDAQLAPRPEPRDRGHRPRRDARRRQRRAAHLGLRRDPRRDRHVRDALPVERRGGHRGHPGGPRQRLPVRGPADGVQAVRGPVLPLPVSDPAATRARSGLLGRRGPGRSCPGSWACSRPTRCSSSSSGSAIRWPAACSCSTPSMAPSRSCRLRRDPACPVCSDAAVAARAAGAPLVTATVGADAPFVLGTPVGPGSISSGSLGQGSR